MRNFFVVLLLLTSCTQQAAVPTPGWVTDLAVAKAAAQKENKAILLDFTGSDWCVWCQRLKAEVFDTREFNAYAAKNLILVEVDFPQRKKQSIEEQRANQMLAATYKIQGYPSIILLDSNGKWKGQTGYQPGGPKPFISELGRLLDSKVSSPEPQQEVVATPPSGAAPAPAVTTMPIPKPVYSELQLKGITGTSRLRLALINGHTFSAGEESKLLLGDKTVLVKCLEITDTEAKVEVDGKSTTLTFKK
ncbi:MAG: thioredoxin-related protein [Verrucomicrobiales bacterium]|nr:thioredoxin-related protein [Verrucomicrobiales bacterium]